MSASSAAPDSEPQRIERPEAGFAITLPWHWHHAEAEDGDLEVWWDAEVVGDAGDFHERQRAAGLLLMARAYLPDGPALQHCFVEDFTARAAMPPAWTSVGDAWFDLLPLREDPDVITAEATNLVLPSGRSVRFDVFPGSTVAPTHHHITVRGRALLAAGIASAGGA